MDGYQDRLVFLAVLVLAAAAGSGCRSFPTARAPLPRVLPPQPTAAQIIEVVNCNSARIQSFSTDRATITAPGLPSLRATVAMQRPCQLRLQADTALTAGPELDLGSNSERFWVWFRGDPGGAIYYCRHDQFAQSAARNAIPIAPAELIDVLGLAEFDPSLSHQGPRVLADGRFEIRTTRETPEGTFKKLTIVDPAGWIAEQHFYDARGQLALSSVASDPRRDPLSGLVMPRRVDIHCPQSQFRLQVNLGNVEINTLSVARPGLFDMPQLEGARLVDLGDPNVQLGPPTAPMGPAQMPSASRAMSRHTW